MTAPAYLPRRARKIGGSYQATGTILAEFTADDGTPRYVFRFDTPAGLLHIFGAAQLEIDERPYASLDALPSLSPRQLEGWATSLADLVMMWVDDGTKMGTDWRPGLRHVIERRLARLNDSAPATTKTEMAVSRAFEIVRAVAQRNFHAMGMVDVVETLEDVSLAEMIEASRIVEAENAKPSSEGKRTLHVVPDDRLIAAAYALANYEPSHGAVVSEPEGDGLVKALAIVRLTAAPPWEGDHV